MFYSKTFQTVLYNIIPISNVWCSDSYFKLYLLLRLLKKSNVIETGIEIKFEQKKIKLAAGGLVEVKTVLRIACSCHVNS